MKFLKLSVFLAVMLMTAFVFQSCEDSTTSSESPVISSIAPSSGAVGTEITITGSGFGADTDPGSVYFGTIQAPDADYTSWTDTKIVVKVPTGVTAGFVKLKVYNGKTAKYSNEVDFCVGGACAVKPDSLRATSINETTLRIKWNAANESAANFSHYSVSVYDGATQVGTTATVDKASKVYTKTGLTAGKIYTFKVKAVYGTLESDAATIDWSPAYRYSAKLYETDSQSGSGLQLDPVNGPVNLTVANGNSWDLGLDTRNSSNDIGSPNKLSYDGITNPRNTLVWLPDHYLASKGYTSLDDVYDTEMLQPVQAQIVNMNGITKSFLFAIKTQDNYYAKIFVKAVDGVILQGTAPNRYVEVEVSLQKTVNVPYAH